MSNYYRRLRLSNNPIADFFDIDQYAYTKRLLRYSQVMFPKDILKNEILNDLHSIGLDVSHTVLFSKPTGRREDVSMMHTDINWDYNEKKWVKELFSVNWELTNTQTRLSWWKTSRQEVFPEFIDSAISPEGIHYGDRFLLGIFPDTDIRLDSLLMTNSPVLLKTNEPHTVDVLPNDLINTRLSLSVRFKNKFKDWDSVLEKFNSIIK